ncbi:hypothetical protein Fot_38250 [Forsythia ovata]|uniref:Uncharacterized protein n=1 Tax=Forsythia ovata TaxID=205694 RepID=A0ABD1S194_9LAMI
MINEGIVVGSDNIDGCYVLTMQCSNEMDVDNDIIDEDFFHQKEISSQLNESLVYNDLPTDVVMELGSVPTTSEIIGGCSQPPGLGASEDHLYVEVSSFVNE